MQKDLHGNPYKSFSVAKIQSLSPLFRVNPQPLTLETLIATIITSKTDVKNIIFFVPFSVFMSNSVRIFRFCCTENKNLLKKFSEMV